MLAAWAFIGALIMSQPVGKDMDQHHSCAALGARRTSDHAWRIANIRGHFFLPRYNLAERGRLDFLDWLRLHLGSSNFYKMMLCAAFKVQATAQCGGKRASGHHR